MNHQIGKTSLHIQASRKADGFALQTAVSEWFWQALLPELSRALDGAVPNDVVVRLNRLDIELPMSSMVNWQEKLTPSVCRAIVEEILRRRLFPRPTDEPVEEMPVSENGFSAWLQFLKTGQKPLAIGSFVDWQTAALATVATSPVALERLTQVFMAEPRSLERLIRQHDALFLGQLLEAMMAKSAADIQVWLKVYETLFFTEGVKQALALPSVDRRAVHFAFWFLLLDKIKNNTQVFDNQQTATIEFFINMITLLDKKAFSATDLSNRFTTFFQQKLKESLLLKPLRRREEKDTEGGVFVNKETKQTELDTTNNGFKAIRQAEQVQARQKQQRDFLQNAWKETIKPLAESDRIDKLFAPLLADVFDNIETPVFVETSASEQVKLATQLKPDAVSEQFKKKTDAAQTDIPKAQNESNERPQNEGKATNSFDEKTDKQRAEPRLPEGESLYVGLAGLVLLHSFIEPFFEALNLLKDSDFVDEAARLRGVGLLQFLAVGDADVVEYDAALLKLLCAVSFDTPIDSRLDLTKEERKEAQELLETVIKYWGAMGDVGVESLQQAFLLRDGKLKKRSDGWLLQIEKQTIDILLDKLPWGFGIIKLPWQADMLFVEW